MVRSLVLTTLSLAFALTVSAASIPLQARQDGGDSSSSNSSSSDNGGKLSDPDILNFALTLEHLEAQFYAQAMKNYTEDDFNKAGFKGIRSKIQMIADDEAQHVGFLTDALKAAGGNPVGASEYVFPSTDVKSFLGLSQILEGVGVSAYLGAAPAITNKAYLSAAGSILTVEARHNAFIRYINNKSPFPSPTDAALTPRSVVSLAAGFFAPGAPNAPSMQPFPALTVKPQGDKVVAGATITVTATGNSTSSGGEGKWWCGFLSGVTAAFSEWDMQKTSCVIPKEGVSPGQVYVLLTSAQNVTDATTIAGPAIIDISKS